MNDELKLKAIQCTNIAIISGCSLMAIMVICICVSSIYSPSFPKITIPADKELHIKFDPETGNLVEMDMTKIKEEEDK